MSRRSGPNAIISEMRVCANTLPEFARYAREGRVVVFDTETTGQSRNDEICQIAAAEYVNGCLERTLNVYLRPSCEMNPYAEGVHGLSMEFLSENGIEPVDAMEQFFGFLGNDVLLVAHNSSFDLRMLQQECAKYELEYSPEGVETCDTLALSRHLMPDLESHSLGALIEPLGVEGENSHDALDDALACAGVFFKLVEGKDEDV